MTPSLTISTPIAAPPHEVVTFIREPGNFRRWLSFVTEVTPSENPGEWLLRTHGGTMALRFVAENEFGVVDHWVRLESGLEVLNPMRVIPNAQGSSVLFTLFRSLEMTEEQFRADASTVRRDLALLKAALED